MLAGMLRLLLATVHLLALGIGLGAVWGRARGLREPIDRASLRRAFAADSWWGLSALLWISTGLWRVLSGTEKPTTYYMHNHVFFAKMGLLVVILLLEIWPMITLIRWRAASGRGSLDPVRLADKARVIRAISYLQAVIIVWMVALAASMARGFGVSP
jgi:putative membrane protein